MLRVCIESVYLGGVLRAREGVCVCVCVCVLRARDCERECVCVLRG